jgi:hypothetical protein
MANKNKNEFDNWVFKELMNKYGHIEDVEAEILTESDYFHFDPHACLSRCNGLCCKDRNYLMIVYHDILKIVDSPVASYLNIHSTIDLYEHNPPYIELFLNEEYDMYLPYLRFLPLGGAPDILPEEAEHTICPFLYPIDEIYSFYDLTIPQEASKDAMGCILMAHKPLICKLSPVSQSRGMETGNVSYRYVLPNSKCPGCKTYNKILISDHLRDTNVSSEESSREMFHTMVMLLEHLQTNEYKNRFNSILLEFYNIDQLLSTYGQSSEKRPRFRHLMNILIDAALGDFSFYDRFINRLATFKKKQFQYQKGAMAKDFFETISDQMSKFQYSIAPFLEKTTQINIYAQFFEFDNFYYPDWEKQDLNHAKGLCQHLSVITKQYLSELTLGSRRFVDYFDIFFATNVYESKFFTWPTSFHVCLMLFKKGSTEKCWVLDPCFNVLARCYKEKNTSKRLTLSDEIFTTKTDHKYIIPAAIGSTIRETLEVNEGKMNCFSASSNTFIPLFIYEKKSLILAKVQVHKRKVKIQYYEHKAGHDFSEKSLIFFNTPHFNALNQYNNVFSLLGSLQKKVYPVKKSDLDKHQRLVSSELEEENMPILFSIENIIVQYYKRDKKLTDNVVSNVLKELIAYTDNKPFTMSYMNPHDEVLHSAIFDPVASYLRTSKASKRIQVNALKKILGSVKKFSKKSNSKTSYLDFVIAYFP